MLAIAEPRARSKTEYFYRPSRDGHSFLLHFPALRTGLLSLDPSGTSPSRTRKPEVDAHAPCGLRRDKPDNFNRRISLPPVMNGNAWVLEIRQPLGRSSNPSGEGIKHSFRQ